MSRITADADLTRTKVLFLQSQTYFGADSRIHAVIMGSLDRETHEVHVAVNRGTAWDASASLRALREVPDVHIRPTSFGTSISFRGWKQRVRDTVLDGPRSLVSLVGLVRYARRHRIDVVHGTEKPRDAFYCYVVAKLARARYVVHLHVGVNHDWMSPLVQFSMRHADGLIAVSEFVRQTAIQSGYDADRVHTALNALDPTEWDPSIDGAPVRADLGLDPDTVLITNVSRIYPWKGQTELLRALAVVTPDFPGYRLAIVGEDDVRATPGNVSYTAELKRLVAELGLDDHVTFTGFRSDIPQIQAAADIYAMPSFEEPFGMVFLEAQAMEVPVVALDNGGTPDAVAHEESGLLSPPGDIDALAANLLRLMRDPEERRKMGRRGRARVLELYSPARLAADVAGIYQRVLAAPRHRPRRGR